MPCCLFSSVAGRGALHHPLSCVVLPDGTFHASHATQVNFSLYRKIIGIRHHFSLASFLPCNGGLCGEGRGCHCHVSTAVPLMSGPKRQTGKHSALCGTNCRRCSVSHQQVWCLLNNTWNWAGMSRRSGQ